MRKIKRSTTTPLLPQTRVADKQTKTRGTNRGLPVSMHNLFSLLSIFGWATLLSLGLCAWVIQVVQSSRGVTDFCQDYFAVQHLLHGESPYLPLRSLTGESLCPGLDLYDSHPPFSVFLFLPFGLFPQTLASTAWGLVSLVSYLIGGLLLLREMGWRLLRGMALFVLGSLLWTPALLASQTHNLGLVVTGLIVGAWVLDRRKHAVGAGALFAVAGLLRLWPIAFLLSAFIWRKWSLALGCIVTLVGGLVLSILVLKPAAFAVYLGPVQAEERFVVPAYSNPSLVGDVARLFIGYDARPPLPPLVQGLSQSQAVLLAEGIGGLLLGATFIFIWYCSRKVRPEVGELLTQGLLVVMLLLVFPITWYWGLVTLILPAATTWLALQQLPRPPRWWALLLLGLIPLLIPGGILVALPGWLLTYQDSKLAGLANLLTWLPTCALLLFAGVQAQLLWWARRPVTAPPPERILS